MEMEKDYGNMRVVITGSPNVGKSVLFNELTRSYGIVSNYPGTTVELSSGYGIINETQVEFLDTPGMYSLFPVTEEEKAARDLLFEGSFDLILHVVDAKNLLRMLPLTLQLIEAGLPVILILNMWDEAEKMGIEVDLKRLEDRIGIPVISTAASEGRGINELKETIYDFLIGNTEEDKDNFLDLNCLEPLLQSAVNDIAEQLSHGYGSFSNRILAELYLCGDSEIKKWIQKKEGYREENRLQMIREHLKKEYKGSLDYIINIRRKEFVDSLLKEVLYEEPENDEIIDNYSRVDRLLTHPLFGIITVVLVLYFGLYRFVGTFAAGTVVDFLEGNIFRDLINPTVNELAEVYIGYPQLRELIAGEYGIITLGFRYALAIILPVVGSFFLVFAVLEDSGYFPRLAFLVDGIMKKLGMNGRAVIPIVLGLGCDTMATMTTRILQTKRERIIATFLLSLAVPCSAQLGVIMGLLAVNRRALFFWGITIGVIFWTAGVLAGKFLPGKKPSFYMELPPLRRPQFSNVVNKTFSRMRWYFLEILPIFIYASILIWLGRLTGVFQKLLSLQRPFLNFLGLPEETSSAFLFGFFRRDYGAAGLYDLVLSGELSTHQLTVAAVTLTLFVPCIAQLVVVFKERGLVITLLILGLIFPFAFFTGYLVNHLLFLFPV